MEAPQLKAERPGERRAHLSGLASGLGMGSGLGLGSGSGVGLELGVGLGSR